MKQSKAICVYCASSSQIDKSYIDAAYELGCKIADSGNAMVCGAGNSGLMGALIDGVLNRGGQAIGIIPQFMVDNGWHHPHLTHLKITPNMHTHKKLQITTSITYIEIKSICFHRRLQVLIWTTCQKFSCYLFCLICHNILFNNIY